MLGRAAALAAMLMLAAAAWPAQAAILRVTIDGLGYFDVDTTTPPVVETVGGLTMDEYNCVVDLVMLDNGVRFTEANMILRTALSGGNSFQLGAAAPLAPGALRATWMLLVNSAFHARLSVGTISCAALNTDCAFASPRTGTVTSPSNGDVPVPVPGALVLFGAGLLGLTGTRRRRRSA